MRKPMAAARYHFHCTDGQDAVFDRTGRWVRNPELVWSHAERTAREIMAGCKWRLNWSKWIVDIHDGSGRHVGTLNFTDVREQRQAA